MRHWLSFADGALPEGTQFLGVVIVRAPNFIMAVQLAHLMKINPGGEVKGLPIPNDMKIHPTWVNVLLTRAECERFDQDPTVPK